MHLHFFFFECISDFFFHTQLSGSFFGAIDSILNYILRAGAIWMEMKNFVETVEKFDFE